MTLAAITIDLGWSIVNIRKIQRSHSVKLRTLLVLATTKRRNAVANNRVRLVQLRQQRP